jgi:hypothetical protein
MTGWDRPLLGVESQGSGDQGRRQPIELVGPHLRLTGSITLGRFNRLSDLVNHTRGYVIVHDARLLRRNGEPTRLTLPRILVNQDEISFIAQMDGAEDGPASADAIGPGGEMERPLLGHEKVAREFVLFTPGHTISGSIHLFGETELLGFADANDPRFVPVVGVRAQSLADRRVISHYTFVLVNRTQMIALSEVIHEDPSES